MALSTKVDEGIRIPRYDKTAFNGLGDRIDATNWDIVSTESDVPAPKVVFFEGWCLGFKAIDEASLRAIIQSPQTMDDCQVWQRHKVDHLLYVNDCLKKYHTSWNLMDLFIHLDARDISWVYKWREEAEHNIRSTRGLAYAMTLAEVKVFVDGYMPFYELYTENLRKQMRDLHAQHETKYPKVLRLRIGLERNVESWSTF